MGLGFKANSSAATQVSSPDMVVSRGAPNTETALNRVKLLDDQA